MDDRGFNELMLMYELNRNEVLDLQGIFFTQCIAIIMAACLVCYKLITEQDKKWIKYSSEAIFGLVLASLLGVMFLICIMLGSAQEAYRIGIENYRIEQAICSSGGFGQHKQYTDCSDSIYHEHQQWKPVSSYRWFPRTVLRVTGLNVRMVGDNGVAKQYSNDTALLILGFLLFADLILGIAIYLFLWPIESSEEVKRFSGRRLLAYSVASVIFLMTAQLVVLWVV